MISDDLCCDLTAHEELSHAMEKGAALLRLDSAPADTTTISIDDLLASKALVASFVRVPRFHKAERSSFSSRAGAGLLRSRT
jgi:hypothetical protein